MMIYLVRLCFAFCTGWSAGVVLSKSTKSTDKIIACMMLVLYIINRKIFQ